jgi:hypothetical protein
VNEIQQGAIYQPMPKHDEKQTKRIFLALRSKKKS